MSISWGTLDFKPLPYSFMLTDIFDRPLILDEPLRRKIVAHCPPFHILLDHTIAVLWMLFSTEDAVPLRSPQITWALRFLEGMTNEHNTYAKDIRRAIECLQSALVTFISREKQPGTSEGEEVKSLQSSGGRTSVAGSENSQAGRDEYGKIPEFTSTVGPLGPPEPRKEFKSIMLRDMMDKS